MLKTERKSITIGIYAHNCASDILYLLRSILKQKGANFSIDEILIISDKSTDSTVSKVSKYVEKNPILKLLHFDVFKGKLIRLNQIFNMAKSDYIVIFDGDIILTKSNILEKMVNAFQNQNSDLVSVNMQPMALKGLKANIIRSWQELQYKTRKSIRNGNNIYNFHGSAFGISTIFAKRIIFPNVLKNDTSFLYLVSRIQKVNFTFIPDATALFHTPANFQEYLHRKTLINEERKSLLPIFGKEVQKEFKVPFYHLLGTNVVAFIKNPFILPVSFIFKLINLIPAKHIEVNDSSFGLNPTKRKIQSY